MNARSIGKAIQAGALVVSLSLAGLAGLKQHEGTGPSVATHEGLVYQAYPDPYYGWKVPTICYGHTKGVKRGDTATQEQCDAFLREDAEKHCKLVYDALVGTGVTLTQVEQDAYCSFAYNMGRFKNTPSVYGRLINGDHWGACEGLLKYTYSNGQYSKGLYNRRVNEYRICTKDLPIKE